VLGLHTHTRRLNYSNLMLTCGGAFDTPLWTCINRDQVIVTFDHCGDKERSFGNFSQPLVTSVQPWRRLLSLSSGVFFLVLGRSY
jgi:hypothetical protein